MNNQLDFDKNGYLMPYEVVETNLVTIEKYLVKAFPNSKTRRTLFDNYERFLIDFQTEIFPHFEQWIGGSFVSQKENPSDIDVVTFLDYKVEELRGKKLDKFWTFSLEDKLIDSYIVKVYPENHALFEDFKRLKFLKHKLFSSTKKEELSRGYLKLNFSK